MNYIEKFRESVQGRTMIFIDAANLEQSVKDMWVDHKDSDLRWKVVYEPFNNFFKANCDLRGVYFYTANFESESHNRFLGFLKKVLHFTLRTKPLKEYKDHTLETPHRKANFDVELSVDATQLIDDFDTFILFSGDCDFEYLLKFLRGKNKTTIVFSRKGHVSKELPLASNYYFDIANFRDVFLKVK